MLRQFIIVFILMMSVNICHAQTSLPVITQQPSNVITQVGKTATFSVVATGATSYQWWDSVAGGPFTVMTGQISASRTTGALTLVNSGNQYYCVVSNVVGSVQSNTVNLTVTSAPTVAIVSISVSNTTLNCSSPQVCEGNATCLSECTNTPTGFTISST